MVCINCGKENVEGAKFCVECGAEIKAIEKAIPTTNIQPTTETAAKQPIQEASPATEKKMSGKAIAGFVLSLVGAVFAGVVCGILGTIFSAGALKEINKNENLKGAGMATAGLIISILDIAFGALSFLIFFIVFAIAI